MWKKIGRIFDPSNLSDGHSYASVPIAERLEGDLFNIYFSSRDESNKSYTRFITIDITDPKAAVTIEDSFVLTPGSLGTFDDSGAMASWITETESTKYLYYIGWNLGVTVPFRNSIGIASKRNNKFFKMFDGPILDRTYKEPHFVASCCVLKEDNKWIMWYLACTDWIISDGRPVHKYHIRYAESNDGISWNRHNDIAIDFKDDKEIAISRPCVIKDNDCWRMWYSYRGEKYRIGYAESLDGKSWTRKDELAGIEVSEEGWDSDMIEYPYVFDHQGHRYMLYNGNDYGKSGIGLAVLDE